MRCEKFIGLVAMLVSTVVLSAGPAMADGQQCNSGPVPIASNTGCSSDGGDGGGGGSAPNCNSCSSSSGSSSGSS